MAGTIRDPIADLAKEIEAEEAAALEADDAGEEAEAPVKTTPAKRAPVKAKADDGEEGDDEAEEEGDDEAEEEGDDEAEESEEDKAAAAKKKAEEEKPKKPKGRFVPVARVNEEAAKRRQAERRAEELQARLAEAQAAAKDGKTPLNDDDRKKIVDAVRSQERVRVRSENLVNVAYEEYGQKEFDQASGVLADLGAPDDMIMISLEACGSASSAARALFMMAQDDAEKIEKIFEMNPLRMAAKIAEYAEKGRKKVAKKAAPVEELDDEEDADEEADEAPPVRRAGKKVSQAPDPARPIRGSRKANDDEITDNLSEDEFTDRFDRMMNKRTSARFS